MARRRARYLAIAAQGHPEGRAYSYTTYNNWGCRCEPCAADKRRYDHARRAPRFDHPAGRDYSIRTYKGQGCRCEGCQQARREHERARRAQ